VDEVGRGCLAGPLLVVAARQIIALPDGVADSKLLSRYQRQKIYMLLKKTCQFGEGWVSATEIDERGLSGAMRLGVARALWAIGTKSEEEVVIDGRTNYAPPAFTRVSCVIRGDNSVKLISAASIHAKVRRDQFMVKLAFDYPAYGFERHVGYDTPAHRSALKVNGALKQIHRMSFGPLKSLHQDKV